MNFFNIDPASASSIWEEIKKNTMGSPTTEASGVDISFVTPTLLALGKFTDLKVESLLTSLNRQPALVWNLSGKPFSQVTKERLGSQIIEVLWKTPGQYTQVPSVASIFSFCYSMKSWLDLNDDHVAVVHCANGRSRTGILIACFLKYIGAFESSSAAFNFFTSARVKLASTPSLAPSYRILFENIDTTVDSGKLPNPFPLHLRSISLSGLPIDDLPCLEVWDENGPLFCSYEGTKPRADCSWFADYGDGKFMICKDILGDFSILIRFGGRHATTRDRTTLILKYQNCTSFLPPDTVELRRQNVDISPDYNEHVDSDMFVMHLTFEQPFGNVENRKLSYHAYDTDAFEIGLNEISKHHVVEPDSDKYRRLIDLGCSSTYSTVALQLSNNSTDKAIQLNRWMRDRSESLGLSTESVICPVCNENEESKRDQLVNCTICNSKYHTQCIGARRIPYRDNEREGQNRKKYIAKNFGSWCCPNHSPKSDAVMTMRIAGTGNKVAVENTDLVLNPPMSNFPDKAITTSLSSSMQSAPSSDSVTLGNGSPAAPFSSSISPPPPPPSLKRSNSSSTKHDQAAILLGLLTSKGITIEKLMSMEESQQRETLFAISSDATRDRNKENTADIEGQRSFGGRIPEDLYVRIVEDVRDETRSVNNSGVNSDQNIEVLSEQKQQQQQHQLKNDPRFAKYLKMVKVGLAKSAVADKMCSENIVSSFEDALKILELDPDGVLPKSLTANMESGSMSNEVKGSPLGSTIPSAASDGSESSSTGVSLKDHPTYAKYFKMLKVGLPIDSVKLKMHQDGIDPTMLDKDPSENIAVDSSTTSETIGVKLKDHPSYAKYFKMLKVGLPKDAVKAKMEQEGVNPTFLDKDPEENLNESSTSEEETVTLGDHPMYSKYFKMLKVGLPREAVKAKMQQAGIDPSMLDRSPDEKVSLSPKNSMNELDHSTPKVPAEDHPLYSKYFKMLKVGLPKEAVKAKMKLEGADPNILDLQPTDLVPLESEKSANDRKVAFQDHPQLSKYFKMLKVGLPKDTVKAKMTQEGIDPSYIDRDPTDLTSLDLQNADGNAEMKKKSPVLRKKRLHWRPLDASKVKEGTLWGMKDGDDEDIHLDEAEFNQLFVESKEARALVSAIKSQDQKKQRINLIDMKRGQNAGIALARIKISYDDIKVKIMQFEDGAFSTDQLKSLEEYLPSPEEVRVMRAFTGDYEMLGQAEKYMSVMMGFDTASKRIQCMIFKQQFKQRILEVKGMVTKIEAACDDVKMSLRFKKVLKTILKVGNQLNDGADHAGFTVDSLLKLQSAKAFDKKTSILQYVVSVIHRHDKPCLLFTDDLQSVGEASRITMDSITTERTAIENNLKICSEVVRSIKDNFHKGDEDPSSRSGIDSMDGFLSQAKRICEDLVVSVDTMKGKYNSLLQYFGEEPTMLSHEFFATLNKFLQEFALTRDTVERMVKANERRKESEAARSRRASVNMSGSSIQNLEESTCSESPMVEQRADNASDASSISLRSPQEISASSVSSKVKRRGSSIF